MGRRARKERVKSKKGRNGEESEEGTGRRVRKEWGGERGRNG